MILKIKNLINIESNSFQNKRTHDYRINEIK